MGGHEKSQPEINDQGLILRPWRADDAAAVHRACQDPAIQRRTGSVDLNIRAQDPDVAEVGFLAAPRVRGRGYTTAAVTALCEWAFAAVGLARIVWRAQVGNVASRRVAEKVGFTIEGTQRAALPYRDERKDAWVGGLVP